MVNNKELKHAKRLMIDFLGDFYGLYEVNVGPEVERSIKKIEKFVIDADKKKAVKCDLELELTFYKDFEIKEEDLGEKFLTTINRAIEKKIYIPEKCKRATVRLVGIYTVDNKKVEYGSAVYSKNIYFIEDKTSANAVRTKHKISPRDKVLTRDSFAESDMVRFGKPIEKGL